MPPWHVAGQLDFTRIYKIRPAKKCGYRGKIGSTKHSGGNSNIPEKVETTRREDARRDTTKVSI
jgi:hypothetical protein